MVFRNRKGFTLIEVLVTVIIVGALAALAFPSISFSIEQSRSAEGVRILGALRTAQLTYEYENPGSYASSLADLDIAIPSPNNFNGPSVADDPTGVAAIQRNGTGGFNYTLEIDEDGDLFCTNNASPTGTCAKLGY